jgi:hypothetical protein
MLEQDFSPDMVYADAELISRSLVIVMLAEPRQLLPGAGQQKTVVFLRERKLGAGQVLAASHTQNSPLQGSMNAREIFQQQSF